MWSVYRWQFALWVMFTAYQFIRPVYYQMKSIFNYIASITLGNATKSFYNITLYNILISCILSKLIVYRE